MRTTALVVLGCLALVGGCGMDGVGSVRSAATEALTLDSNTSASIAGSYVRDGSVLRFAVSTAQLQLRDGGGRNLIKYAVNADGSTTLSILDSASITGFTDASGTDQEVDQGDVDGAITALMARAEIQMAPYLSASLASHGASGTANPLSLRLHTLAQQLSGASGVDPAASPSPSPSPMMCDGGTPDMAAPRDMAPPRPHDLGSALSRSTPQQAADDCVDISNNYCNSCLGMCGRGCSCWRWVCGDCCWHQGCFQHDLHCRACDRHHPRECLLCALFDFGRPLFRC